MPPSVQLEHWREAWRTLGAKVPEQLFHQLIASHSEPHRHYHTMQHLNECFEHLATLRSLAERSAEIEIALWFHDAIYDTKKKDNEEKSADWARDSAQACGVDSDAAARIHALIMVTRHNAIPEGRDAEILVDIDLGILGADRARFDEYEQQVRKEYSWVPGLLYRMERRKVLEEFAGRSSIYSTETFRASREAQARDNLARSLAKL